MIAILFTLCFILIINLFIISYYNRKKHFKSLENTPDGCKSYPIIGSALEFGFNSVDNLKNLVRHSNSIKNVPFVKVWLGPWHLYLLTTDPQFTEFILSSPVHINKSYDYRFMKSFMLNGLITSNGSYWQKHRKLINPVFSNLQILEAYVRVMNSKSNILIQNLANNANKGDFDVYRIVANCSLDIIVESAMGVSVNAQTTTDNKFLKHIKILSQVVLSRIFSAWKRFDILFQFSQDYKNGKKSLEYLMSYTQNVIDERRKMLNKTNNNEEEKATDDFGIKKKQMFLDNLLRSKIDGKELTSEEILQEVNTFIAAGYDTTTSLVCFAVHELARNPDIQNKLFLEVQEIYHNDTNYKPTLKDLKQMKYTELVLKETLRLFPSIPAIVRQLDVDANYKGTIIPKDTMICLFTYGMQRREDLFPNPTKFDPERFISQRDTFTPFSYVPFSAGPRNCIGQQFGMLAAKCMLSKIVLNYEILPDDSNRELVLASEIALVPENGVYIQLKSRKM